MVRIWEEVLGLEGLGMEDNFFDLGGNSLKANEIALEIQALTGIPVPIKVIFDGPTPGSVAKHQAFTGVNGTRNQAMETGLFADTMTVEKNPPQPAKPNDAGQSGLSENQKALWFLQQIDPRLSAYHIFYSIKFTGSMDVDCLETALQEILYRHETLRTKFSETGPYANEYAHGKDGGILEIFGAPNAAPEILLTEALDHARKIADLPFNFVEAYPFRFILYKLDKDHHLLAFIIHHIVFDGISFGIFLKELQHYYRRAQTGIKPGMVVQPYSYSAFCSEEQHYINGSQYEADRLYWQKQLLHAPVFFEIPTDFIRTETPSREGGQVRRKMNPVLKLKLKSLGDLHGASMFMTCLSAFSVLLFRHAGQHDFLIGVPAANRVKKSFLSLIGYFVNTMLFRVRIDPCLSFEDWLAQVKDGVLENLSHSRFPLSHMSEVLKTERIQGVNPFFQIMFAYHDTDWDFSMDNGLTGIAEEQFFGRSKFDIFTEIFDRQEEAEIVITFSAGLYQRGTIEILLDHYLQILENICVEPKTRLSEISLMSADEYNRTVYEWNQTAFSHNIKPNVSDLIIQQIANTPDLPALVSRYEVVSYREMGEKTDRIAANLHRLGVERGMPVGIHLENSPAMVMCIMAVFRAGGIYVPLDPYYPEERLRYVIEKTKIRFLVVDEERKNRTPQLNERIIPVSELLAEPDISPLPGSGGLQEPEDIAYIMFTSGSTGNPKGVVIRHDSLLNFLVWMKMELNVTAEDTFLSTTSINFDISFLEIFTPLISGARLVLEKRDELQAPEKVEAILNEMRVNTVQFVPSGLKALCDAGVLKRARYLKTIISGGEKLSRSLQEQIFRESDGKLINLYGPTEATVYMACWHCRRNSPLRMVPIGYPIFNSTLYILNEKLEPVGIGITGEVYLGGQVLADGYFEDPVQTASRFIPDPFSENVEDRIYRTGDLARFLADGAVEFLGRTDHQVKVRGFRVELGEIESNILRFPGIRRVVVLAQEQREEDIRISAFIVPDPEMEIQENELRNFLKLHLPAYMIPGSYIIAPSIPALPNGKTDIKTLLSLRPQVPKIPDFYLQHMNEPEIHLTAIWKEILDHEAFTPVDNFFEVGGHSLLLVKMKDIITEKLSFNVSIVDLFRYPTIRSLATFMSHDKPCQPVDDISKRVAMRNRNIRNQMGKRLSPDKNDN
jgi:amino acid adenylation domain-containing protein